MFFSNISSISSIQIKILGIKENWQIQNFSFFSCQYFQKINVINVIMVDLNFTLVIIHDNLSWSPQLDEGIQTQLAPSAQTRTEKYSEEVSPLSTLLSQLSTTQARLKQSHFMIFTFKLWEQSGNLMIFWNLWSRTLGRLAWEIKCNNELYWSSPDPSSGVPPSIRPLSQLDNYSCHSDYYPIQLARWKYLQIIFIFPLSPNQYFTGLSIGDSLI